MSETSSTNTNKYVTKIENK